MKHMDNNKNVGMETGSIISHYLNSTPFDKDSVEAGKEFIKYVEGKEMKNEIEITEGKTEDGKDTYGANIRYNGELAVIPLMRYDTKEEVEARATKILSELKSGDLGEELQELIRQDATAEQKVFEKVKSKYPIVIEMSEGFPETNLGFDYLYQLEKKVKEAGLTDNPTETYIKTKVWFKDYPNEGDYDYVTILNSYRDNEFNPEKGEGALQEYLEKHSPLFDWSIYEYGRNYKFGSVYVPEPKYKEGDLVRIVIDVDISGGKFDYAYGNIISPTKYNKDDESWKPHWEYDVRDKFDSDKIYKDVFENRISLREESEITKEINQALVEKGEAPLLSSEEANSLSEKYINQIKEQYNEYKTSDSGKYWKEKYESNIIGIMNQWFEEVICRYPMMLTEFLKVQIDNLPNYSNHLLNEFTSSGYEEYPNQKQFFNSLMKSNIGKKKLIGLYELLPDILIYDKKAPKKIDWQLDPSSKDLFTILKPIVSNDDLRAKIASINFDENGATATDGLKLFFLYGKTKKTGIYGANKIAYESSEFKKVGDYYIGKKDLIYPSYKAVIPTIFSDVVTLDRSGVERLVNLLRTFKNASYYNLGTRGVDISLYKGELNYFNIHFLLDSLEAWLKIGFDSLEFTYKTYSQKDKSKVRNNILVISPNIDKFTRLKCSGSIIMAIMYDNSGDSIHSINQTEMYIDVVKGIAPTAGINDDLYTENNPAHGTDGAIDEREHIKEIEDMIELLELTLEGNPNDDESKDMLELMQMTLVDLKASNTEKFEKGGAMKPCGCIHAMKNKMEQKFENGGGINDEQFERIMNNNSPDIVYLDPIIYTDLSYFEPYDNLKELREKVRKYVNENFKGIKVINKHTGYEFIITNASIKKLFYNAGETKLKLLIYLPYIISNATPLSVSEIEKFNTSIKRYAKFMYAFESFISIEDKIYEFSLKTFFIDKQNIHVYSGHLELKNPI